MNQQLILPLALPVATQLADYIAGDNQVLIEALQQQRASREQPLIYLSGKLGSGRTHLLVAQCNAAETEALQAVYLPCEQLVGLQPEMLDGLEQADLLAIDDVHCLAGKKAWEQALFHLFNRARTAGCRLLFSAEQAPGNTGFVLTDLCSRLAWGLVHHLKPLHDAEREQLLINLAVRRGLHMPADVARYLLQRQARDTTHLVELVECLDKASMQTQRRLTLPFVRQQLG